MSSSEKFSERPPPQALEKSALDTFVRLCTRAQVVPRIFGNSAGDLAAVVPAESAASVLPGLRDTGAVSVAPDDGVERRAFAVVSPSAKEATDGLLIELRNALRVQGLNLTLAAIVDALRVRDGNQKEFEKTGKIAIGEALLATTFVPQSSVSESSKLADDLAQGAQQRGGQVREDLPARARWFKRRQGKANKITP